MIELSSRSPVPARSPFAVHAKGSYIYMQLWTLGRASDPDALKDDPDGPFDVVSASDIPFEGGPKPRALTEAEIEQYVKDFATAAKNFIEKAGGDGVEGKHQFQLVRRMWRLAERRANL